jgi:hypothetical protein
MIAANFIVEVVLEDDVNSYHGVEIDFEKELNGAVRKIDRVVAHKVTDVETGESYLGRFPKGSTSNLPDSGDSR